MTAAKPRLKLMPCPMPETTAAAMTPANDEKCSATARITIPATRIAQPSATARCGLMFVDATWATADAAKIEHDHETRDRVVVDADDIGQKGRCDRGEQAGHREPREGGERGDDEHRTDFGGHRHPLHAHAASARRRLRRVRHCRRGQHGQHDVHQEAQPQRVRGVFDEQAGQQRADAQRADVGDGRDRRGAVAPRGGAASMTAAVAVPANSPPRTRTPPGLPAAAGPSRPRGRSRRWPTRRHARRAERGAGRWRRTTARKPPARTARHRRRSRR